VECIDIMEEVVSIKKNVYGTDHIEFEKSSEKLCEYLNLAAMIFLQKEKFDVCLDYLRKAELVAQNSLQYKSTTYNNLACYYRRTGKLRTALSYLIQALDLELRM
jgi:tetratricopeptide (TPR) repeat protein